MLDDIAENMKNNGGFIPGIRPGRPTIDYLSKILSRTNSCRSFILSSNSNDTSIHSTFYECKHEFSRYINTNRCRGST